MASGGALKLFGIYLISCDVRLRESQRENINERDSKKGCMYQKRHFC